MNKIGSLFIFIGILFIVFGLLWGLFGNFFSWFGKLPGDIHIHKGNFTLYAPITSMILISLIINVIFYIISKIIH